jgi:beta-lactamase regulating signal transducer with metallopeptidase domain
VAGVLLWIWIAVVVIALVILIVAGARLFGRLGGLQRAAVKLQRRQAEAMKLQEAAGELEQTLLGVQQRAEALQEHLATLSPEK